MDASLVQKSSGPTFAVAFGGGGARGLAHIHVIEVLDELGIKPVALSGSSIGAIMGAAMASGMSGAEIRDHTLSVMTNRAEVMNRIWKLRPSGIGGFLTGGFRLTQFDIENIVETFLPEQVKRDFKDLQIPLSLTATDYYMQEEVIIETGNLRSAIAASAAIPALFKAVKRDGRILIDGGIFNPVPFEHLEGKADFVIGIDVVGGPEGDPSKAPGTIDVLFGTSQLMMQSIIAMKLKASRPAVFLRPPVSQFRVMDFLKARKILDATVSVRDELKRALDAAITFSGKSTSNRDG
jgi:NTE family protein